MNARQIIESSLPRHESAGDPNALVTKYAPQSAGDVGESSLLPSNIAAYAKRKGQSALVNKVAKWAQAAGKRIGGGVAVGKYYDTLVLDLTYQGSEIDISLSSGEVRLYNKPCYSSADFKRIYAAHNAPPAADDTAPAATTEPAQ